MIPWEGELKKTGIQAADETSSNPSGNPALETIIDRRTLIKGLAATGLVALSSFPLSAEENPNRFTFKEISHGVDETHHLADGYEAQVLLRWGDPVFETAPAFDPQNQSGESQSQQFGYNNDFIGYIPLPRDGADERGLLCVNHEYTLEELMVPGLGRTEKNDFKDVTAELVDIEKAAHGGTIVEVYRTGERWQVNLKSKYNRRITVNTLMDIAGPAHGHARMKTNADPQGHHVIGTLNNCAGGITPWGTWLMAEENFNLYFGPKKSGKNHPDRKALKRYNVPSPFYAWDRFDPRFHLEKEPQEPNRFGWIVEVDPFDPQSTPKKRTALGRFKHEGAENIINKDGRLVIYMGDDQRGDYLYKFVTRDACNPDNRKANADLLDHGTLFVAKFTEDGVLHWLPLEFGHGPLTPSNGFDNQGDVVIHARLAADLLGATSMDRPEDVQPNKVTGKVYVMLTNNKHRGNKQPVNVANPRGPNTFGHIIEINPINGDHAADKAHWDILVKCGDPSMPDVEALWNDKTTGNGWFASPDNAATDHSGGLWIASDQGKKWKKTGTADGLWALETDKDGRGTGKMFFRSPIGAEVCGPRFTPNDETLFVAIQHPGADGANDYPGFERDSTYDDPVTRWPDFDPNLPPRPSVLAIRKKGGGKIGS